MCGRFTNIVSSRSVFSLFSALTKKKVSLTNTLSAWKAHADLWRLHCFFSNEDFVAFANPDNFVAQLLIMHMLLLDYVLGPFCVPDTKQFRFPARKRVIISWARQLLDRLPDFMKQYGEWMKDYCNTLEHSTGNYLLSP